MPKFCLIALPLIPLVAGCRIGPVEIRPKEDIYSYAPQHESSRNRRDGRDRSNPQQLEVEIFRLVNRYRQQQGLKPLQRSRALDKLARSHSRQMLQTNRLSHDGFQSRADAAINYGFTRFTENVAFNQNARSPGKTAFIGWQNSPGHDRNMSDPAVSETGIAISVEGNTVYFTQIFGG